MTPQDKRYQEYMEACAKVDGTFRTDIPVMKHYYGGRDQQIGVRESRLDELPTYLDDASIDAVVRKFDDAQLIRYFENLLQIVFVSSGAFLNKVKMLSATPEQKAEALARTIMGEKK